MKKNRRFELKDLISWKAIIIVVILLCVIKKPVCQFSEQQVAIIEPTECDVIERQELFSGDVELPQLYLGMSMYPYIKDNQICLCETAEEYRIGDVVSFYTRYNGKIKFIAHRIVDIFHNGEIVTRGDNNEVTDYNTISKEQIFCKIKEETLLQSIIRRLSK